MHTPHSCTLVMVRVSRRARKIKGLVIIAALICLTYRLNSAYRFTVGLRKCVFHQHSMHTPHSCTLVMVRVSRRARKIKGLVIIAAHIG